jgi:hypothetical protein
LVLYWINSSRYPKEFASRNPELTFVHAYPGTVNTNLLSASESTMLRVFNPVVKIFGGLLTSQEQAGEWLWSGFMRSGKGFSRIGAKGEDIGKQDSFYTPEGRKKLWEHTVEACAP